MSPAIAFAVAQALFHFLWQGAAVAALLAVAVYGLRPGSARVRYALACLAMLAMLAAFGATIAWFWPHTAVVKSGSGSAVLRIPAPPLLLGYNRRAAAPEPPLMSWMPRLWMLGVLAFSLRSLLAWFAAARM